jgi:hypothetical protein
MDTGIATKVSSVNQLVPGDVIVTNDYGHVVLYIGSYDGKIHQVASHSAWGIFSYTYFGTPNEYWHITSASLTDQQKQQEILTMVNSHRGSLPAELVLAVIRQEGGEGAFHVDGWNYDTFYRESDGPWAQPTNGDGIMQVSATGNPYYHEKSGPYTHDCTGYDHAINDGCDYLLELYSTYATQVQSTLHYNTGPKSLYIYLGMNQGDRDYLSKVAEHLSNFVPNTYALQNQNIVNVLNQGQNILNKYLDDMGIATGQSVGYYEPYQTQLDSELHNIETPNDPPNTPSIPSGLTSGQIGILYPYSTVTTDPNSDNVYYWFDWGDGTNSGWIGPYPSGTSGSASKEWGNADTYNVKTKAKDEHEAESSPLWSDSLPVCIDGLWEDDPINPCKKRKLTCTGEYEYQNKDDGTICSCTARNTLKRCYGGVCTDTGICDATTCGADAACDGKEPGDSCGGGTTCDSNCKCRGQAAGVDKAVYRGGLWFVDKDGDQVADEVFGYGFAGATPLVGDINQDGTDDIAVFSAPLWFVDTNGDHLADEVFGYGFAGATPLVGDIDQDGTDDIAVFSAPLWFVDTNGDHLADDVFGYGFAGATPLVGDIDQDGADDIAVFSAPLWFVDTNGDQVADDVFGYGFAGVTPVVGDINQDGTDDIAVFSAPLWFVDTNGDHMADDVFGYGFACATPIVGNIG